MGTTRCTSDTRAPSLGGGGRGEYKKEVEKLEDELSCDVDVEDVSDVE